MLQAEVDEGTEVSARMQGALVIEGGVDITDAQTLGRALWRGVTQTTVAVGPVFGKLPGGGMGCVLVLACTVCAEQRVRPAAVWGRYPCLDLCRCLPLQVPAQTAAARPAGGL